ncbi:hypothetical protein GWI72_09960 [Microvirga tunisiensis]|uniref:Uncharacterized protein n=2 Tax=Pannonibacter tanglangensis TaxID=2750084 RepID=A0A7X5F2I9_9HYPH|nr:MULTISPECIES: hypothetical protein [unclassified Pannonibacter]NBN63020.1 hypothetical protein [Pannonibacter sp. XCT-34]NBN78592.1 hypothetical protein [Pannonibacter sp. XCT-53]
MSKDLNEPMHRAAHLTQAYGRLLARRLVLGKRTSALLFLVVKNLLFWGSMIVSGFLTYKGLTWLF